MACEKVGPFWCEEAVATGEGLGHIATVQPWAGVSVSPLARVTTITVGLCVTVGQERVPAIP